MKFSNALFHWSFLFETIVTNYRSNGDTDNNVQLQCVSHEAAN